MPLTDFTSPEPCDYKGYSKVRTRTAIGFYGRARPRSIGPPKGRCVSLISKEGAHDHPVCECTCVSLAVRPEASYRGNSKLRTRTVLGSYSRAMPRGIGPP